MIQQDKNLVAAFRRAYGQRSITALIAVTAYETATKSDLNFSHTVNDRMATALLAAEAFKRADIGGQMARKLTPSPSQEGSFPSDYPSLEGRKEGA